jgi:hypothetical protein
VNWELFYQLNKSFIDLYLAVGTIGLILIWPTSAVAHIFHTIRDYLEEVYNSNY